MTAEKMIRPPPMRQIRMIRLIAIALSIVGAPFLIAGIIALIDDPSTAVLCFIPGLPLTVGPVLWFRQMTRRRAAFKESLRTANANVIDRKKEKPKRGSTGPLLLEVGIAVADKIKPQFDYWLHLEFTGSKTGVGSIPIMLEAQVNEQVFEQHPPDRRSGSATPRMIPASRCPRASTPPSPLRHDPASFCSTPSLLIQTPTASTSSFNGILRMVVYKER